MTCSLQAMRDEILAGLDRVSHIKVQPRFLAVEGQGEGESPDSDLSHRMISVDSMRSLGNTLTSSLTTVRSRYHKSEPQPNPRSHITPPLTCLRPSPIIPFPLTFPPSHLDLTSYPLPSSQLHLVSLPLISTSPRLPPTHLNLTSSPLP